MDAGGSYVILKSLKKQGRELKQILSFENAV